MGVAQLGGGLGLAGEPLADVLLEGELRGKHLDRDPALEPLVAGAVDHPHAAAADLALDGICVTQRLGEPGRPVAGRMERSSGSGPPERMRARVGDCRTWQHNLYSASGPAATLMACRPERSEGSDSLRQDPSLRSDDNDCGQYGSDMDLSLPLLPKCRRAAGPSGKPFGAVTCYGTATETDPDMARSLHLRARFVFWACHFPPVMGTWKE